MYLNDNRNKKRLKHRRNRKCKIKKSIKQSINAPNSQMRCVINIYKIVNLTFINEKLFHYLDFGIS